MRGEDVVSKCGLAEIQIRYIEFPDFHMVWSFFLFQDFPEHCSRTVPVRISKNRNGHIIFNDLREIEEKNRELV